MSSTEEQTCEVEIKPKAHSQRVWPARPGGSQTESGSANGPLREK